MKDIEESLEYRFKNKELITAALRHSSIKRYAINFERLEFLGDRVLGIVIAEYVYQNFPKESEGNLSKMQSTFVCADACCEIARKIWINKTILTAGKHLMMNKTVLADAMEAVLGAIFLDSNFEIAKVIILKLWHELFKNFSVPKQDPKTKLQEISQAKTGETPIYDTISVCGLEHDPTFIVSVEAMGIKATAEGNSKKSAESLAANKLLDLID
jgi:ribonuclease-3